MIAICNIHKVICNEFEKICLICTGGMRNLSPTLEVNSSDPVHLDANVSAALRAYLPLHFPLLTSKSIQPTDRTTNSDNSTSTDQNDGVIDTTNGIDTIDSTIDTELRIEQEWVGIMGFTPDRNPLVGPLVVSRPPGEFIAAGYTGHGMPVAFLAGRNIADMLYGRESDVPLPEEYSPARFGL